MIQFTKIWCCIMMAVIVIFIADLAILFAETNDDPISEEVNSLGDTNEINPSAEVEPKPENSSSLGVRKNVDPATRVKPQGAVPKTLPTELGVNFATTVDIQGHFNELKSEYLDDRADYIDMWLGVVAIVLTFFGVVIAILGIVGYRKFRELEAEARTSVAEARKLVEEIKAHRARAEEYVSGITSENMDDPDEATKTEEAIRDVQSDPEPSLISKVISQIYTSQRDGEIEDVIEKWHSIANIAEGNDNELAARAWLSIRYLLVEEEKRRDAYNKAMSLDPNYTRNYMNQYRAKYSNLSPHGVVVDRVIRYFNAPKFEKFSTVKEYQIESSRYRADVVLQDEKGRLTTIVECMVNEYIPRSTIAHLKERFRHSGAQFGLLAAGPELSRWTFLKIFENEITEITRSQFEAGVMETGSPES